MVSNSKTFLDFLKTLKKPCRLTPCEERTCHSWEMYKYLDFSRQSIKKQLPTKPFKTKAKRKQSESKAKQTESKPKANNGLLHVFPSYVRIKHICGCSFVSTTVLGSDRENRETLRRRWCARTSASAATRDPSKRNREVLSKDV